MTTKHVEIVTKGKRGRKVAQDMAAIPNVSQLAPYVYKGIEGNCVACNKPIRAHFTKKGGWIGCQALHVPMAAQFLLVPTIVSGIPGQRRSTDKKPSPLHDANNKAKDRGGVRVPLEVTIHRAGHFAYAVVDKRKKIPDQIYTNAMHDAYEALRTAGKPLDAERAAKRAKRPREANRRCLNALVDAKLVQKVIAA